MESLKNSRKIVMLILALSLLVTTTIIYQMQMQELYREKERIGYITQIQASKLQSTVERLFQKTQTLKMLVIQGAGQIENFDSVCKELMDDDSIRSMQLAPDGVVTQVYPLEGNEEAFGDLFADPERATEAIYARDMDRLTMSGPFVLDQGGFGIVGRQPVFFTDDRGNRQFWGFTIIVLDLPDALFPADLDRLVEEGYDYELRRIQPDTKEVQVFAKSGNEPLAHTVDVSFDVPNAQWTLSVVPRDGWIDYTALAIEMTMSLFINLLAVMLAYLLLSLNEQRKQSQKLAITDALTGLYNRRKLQDVLNERCAVTDQPFQLCYMDLNDFKHINDTLGHGYGDQLLIACTRRFQSWLKPEELLFRVGGDEFVALLEWCDEGEAEARIRDLMDLMKKPFTLGEHVVSGSASVGCALFPRDSEDVERLMRIADAAMYEQKEAFRKNREVLSE